MPVVKIEPTRKVLLITIQLFEEDVDDGIFNNNDKLEAYIADGLTDQGLRDSLLDVRVLRGV